MTAPRKDEPVITPADDALARLRDLAEAAVHGTCKVLSIGHACQCPLCDLDLVREDRARLLARIDQLKDDVAFHARCHTEAVNAAVKYEQSLSDSEARCRALEARIVADQHELVTLQQAVRAHRDARGDDRCWLDDESLYKALPEGYEPPARDTTVELKRCERFILNRHNPAMVYVSPQRRIEELEARIEQDRLDKISLQSVVAFCTEHHAATVVPVTASSDAGSPQDRADMEEQG